MIRTIITLITFLSLAGVLDAECVLMPPLESSSHVRISVVLGGKPLKGSRVILYRVSAPCICATDILRGNPIDTTEIPSSAVQITDENGIASLAELAPGEYEVAATLNGIASTAFVGLHVNSSPNVTTIPMDLTQPVQRVEEVPILFHVEVFQGTVRDPSGATLPGASFVVVKRGSQAKDVALISKADANGQFSAQLAEGSYIAVFFSPGFRPAIAPFELTRGGASQLSVSLYVGGCP
jgi:Carboxypeptidase regulatory-like domain